MIFHKYWYGFHKLWISFQKFTRKLVHINPTLKRPNLKIGNVGALDTSMVHTMLLLEYFYLQRPLRNLCSKIVLWNWWNFSSEVVNAKKVKQTSVESSQELVVLLSIPGASSPVVRRSIGHVITAESARQFSCETCEISISEFVKGINKCPTIF